jgi:ribosome modulation factor
MTDKLEQAFLEGYKEGRNVESISDVTRKTAKHRYERWKEINDIGDEDD